MFQRLKAAWAWIAAGFAALLLGWLFWPSPQPTAPHNPRFLTIGNSGEPDTLDPHKYSLVLEEQILQNLFVGLTASAPDMRVIPGIAQSWERSPNGRVWTFHLRPNLKWSDGVPLTAADAVAGLQRAFNPKTFASIATLGYKIRNARLVHEGKLPIGALGVRAPDTRTVEITLEYSSLLLPEILADPQFAPLPRHVFARYGDAWAKPGHMVTDGPFTLVDWRPSERVRIRRNALFYDAAHVAIEGADFIPLEDEDAALRRFRAGELDVTVPFPNSHIPWVRANMPAALHMHSGAYLTYLTINVTHPQFRDVRVRRALSMVIDREFVARTLLKTAAEPAYRIVPPGVALYPSNTGLDFQTMSRDARLAEARRLMAAAGYGPGHPLVFTYRHGSTETSRRLGAVLQAQWKAIGADVTLVQSDVKTHYQVLRSRDFDIAEAGWTFWPDPEYFLLIVDGANLETNYNGYDNPVFTARIAAAKVQLDPQKRMQLYGDAEKLALNDYPITPLVFVSMRVLAAPRVQGVTGNILGLYPLRYMRVIK